MASLLEPAAQGAGERRALLVGINAYPRLPLQGCLHDIAAVQDFLQRERGFAPEHIRVLRDHEATRAAIARELTALAAASRAPDLAVFYFCGHGAQLPTRDPREVDLLDEALCPVDFNGTPDTAILDDELEQIFDSFPPGASVTWIVDACHSGDLDEGLDARVAAVRPSRLVRAAASAHQMAPSERSLFLTACAASERAADILVDGQPRGAFSYHLLTAARRAPQATGAEVLAEVQRALAELGQHPAGSGPALALPFLQTPQQALAVASHAAAEDEHPHATGVTCRAFWWGFHLELPSAALAWLADADAGRVGALLASALAEVPHRVAPHHGAMLRYLAASLAELRAHDRGAGVFVSMSNFAPDLFVITAVPPRALVKRPADAQPGALQL